MTRSRWWSPGLLVALLVLSRPARADHATVVLAVEDPALGEALSTALAPLGLDVALLQIDQERLGESEQNETLRVVAERQGAAAVVWIEPLGAGYLLSAYSARTGETRSCPLGDGPPYDDAAAVAVAFSIKTLLRETSVIATPSFGVDAPEDVERDEGEAEEEEPGGAAVAVLDPDRFGDPGLDDTSLPEMTTEAQPPAATTKRRVVAQAALPARSWLWLDLGVDRAIAGGDSGHASQARAGVTYWPAAAADRLGVLLSIGRTATVESTQGSLDVEFSAFEAILGARLRIPFADRFALIPEVGVALRLSRVGGLSTAGDDAAPTRRTSSVAEGALALAGFIGPRFALALSIRMGVYLWPVQYTWEGEPILEEPWTRGSAGVRAVLAF